MSFLSKIFGGGCEAEVRQPCLDTHRLFKVPVVISFDVVVAAPSEEQASQQAVLDEYLKYILSDLKNRMDEDDVAKMKERAKLGAAELIRNVEGVPEEYRTALPYENPGYPTGADVECRYWFREE